jgi:hypothetical protein
VARALGDGDGKNYGVTADPQFIGWKLRPGQDFALILASDGVWNALGQCPLARPADFKGWALALGVEDLMLQPRGARLAGALHLGRGRP